MAAQWYYTNFHTDKIKNASTLETIDDVKIDYLIDRTLEQVNLSSLEQLSRSKFCVKVARFIGVRILR